MSAVNFEQARFNMVEQQIRTWEVLDPRVLDVIANTPREDYVPAEYRLLAYADIAIPLPHGQSMMKPLLEARLLQSLSLQPGDTVLEIGTGSGFLTALIGGLSRHVHSVEIIPELKEAAGRRLALQDVRNISLYEGDAVFGWPANGPYDAIAVTGSYPADIPHSLLENLKIGGRLFAVTGQAPAMEAVLVTRIGPQEWHREGLFETELAALRNAPVPSRFSL